VLRGVLETLVPRLRVADRRPHRRCVASLDATLGRCCSESEVNALVSFRPSSKELALLRGPCERELDTLLREAEFSAKPTTGAGTQACECAERPHEVPEVEDRRFRAGRPDNVKQGDSGVIPVVPMG
jgi:hypothetical protein